ncbi:transposase [Streptomyces sp. SYSU K217416]
MRWTNNKWVRLEPLLPRGKKPGRPPRWTRRQLIDGIRWRTQAGAAWRDVPERYGQRRHNSTCTKIRSLGERAMATLKGWRLLRKTPRGPPHTNGGHRRRPHPSAASAAHTRPRTPPGACVAPARPSPLFKPLPQALLTHRRPSPYHPPPISAGQGLATE